MAEQREITINSKQIPTVFPSLYNKNARGKMREWKIVVSDEGANSVITTSAGELGGKYTSNTRVISKGKNVGKSNGTTHYQQALLEAQSKWTEKRDSGMYVSQDTAKTAVLIRPMLAHDYLKRQKDIQFPAMTQPKLDGVRALAYISPESGTVVFESREGNEYKHLALQKEELLASGILKPKFYLDGELYNDASVITFQEIVGICRTEKLKEGDSETLKKIQYHIYDCFDLNQPNLPFSERTKMVQKLIIDSPKPFTYLKCVSTLLTKDHAEMLENFGKFIQLGYEGIMIRNQQAPYDIDKRSKNLQKYKEFQTAEYKIVDSTEGDGRDIGTVIWICEYSTPDNKLAKFNVRPKGTLEERSAFFKNAKDYHGKMLTVKFQETTDDNCPRFPVGLTIRDYE